MLLPVHTSAMRRELDDWFDATNNSEVFIRCQERQRILPQTCHELNARDENPQQHAHPRVIVFKAMPPLVNIKTAGYWLTRDAATAPSPQGPSVTAVTAWVVEQQPSLREQQEFLREQDREVARLENLVRSNQVAQFESFVHPFIILLAVPLALIGGLAGLLLFGQTLNIFSQVGLIMLVGLATKNGILTGGVNHANSRGFYTTRGCGFQHLALGRLAAAGR